VSLAYPDLMIWRRGAVLIARRGGILLRGELDGGCVTEKRGMLACVITDVQFWVPVVVLVAGLVLLEMIR
jgi:hypothetical protein